MVCTHEVVHATMLTVEPPLNDAAWDVYHPPPPPTCDTARTPQADPIGIRSDKHNDKHNERALTLIVTNTVKLSNHGSRGAIGAAATPPHPLPMTTTFPSEHDMSHNNRLDAHGITHTDTPLSRAPSITTMSRATTPVYTNSCIPSFLLPHPSRTTQVCI
jgi:hypothetical protein